MLFDTIGMYAQDDYRVLPRLTLNLGLRYEFTTTPNEKRGRQAFITNILTQTVFTPGALQSNPSYKDISPRIGFAWDVFGDGRTSVRGGAALLYDVSGIGTIYGAAGAGPPFALYATTATKPLILPEPLPPAPANTYSPQGAKFTALQYNYTTPHMIDFNLSVERQLRGDVALSVTYAASRGIDLWQFSEGNARCPTSNAYVPVGCSAITTTIGPTQWMNAAAPLENSYFGNINYIHTGGESWYHSLQVNLTKKTSHGLEFQSAYTYSKALDDNQGQLSQDSSNTQYNLNPFITRAEWGPANFDVRQNWRFNALYHIPNIGSSMLAKVEHGWWVGTIVGVQTGQPFQIVLNTNRDQSGENGNAGAIDRPDVVTSANIASIQAAATAACDATAPVFSSPACGYTPVVYNKNTVITGTPGQWYNASMFALPAVGVLGTESHNMLTGPGVATWDLNLNKNTALPKLGEAGQLQFRAEVFNLLNHPNFGLPSGTAFTGTVADVQEKPLSTPISTTTTDPREFQFSVKILF